MTALHPVASKLSDRTGASGADQGVPSVQEMAICLGFPSQNQLDKGRIAIYRARVRPDILSYGFIC